MTMRIIPPAFNGRRMAAYLLAYVLAWTFAHVLAGVSLDGYGDMLENYAWGQVFALGTFKHPPLIAWMTQGWFAVMPRTDDFYYLLAYVNAALGLFGVYRLGVAWGLRREAGAAVLLLAMALPYSTLAGKFNANAVLLSLWPWVAVACLNSIHETDTRKGLLWSAGLGLLAALSMLGKYYSGVFLLSLFIMALAMPAGRRWLFTVRPWLALALFGLCLLPHWWWLAHHEYITFHYVQDQGDGKVGWGHMRNFILSPIIYWGLPWLLCCLLVAPAGERWRGLVARMAASWRPRGWDDGLFWLAMSPWLITVAFGLSSFVELSLPWAIPVGFGFTLLWLRNLAFHDRDAVARAQGGIVKVFWGLLALAVLLSPLYAWRQAEQQKRAYYVPRLSMATALLNEWQLRYPGQALRWVGGQWSENAAVAFYGNPDIRIVPGVPDAGEARFSPIPDWRAQPGVLLCELGYRSARADHTLADSACVQQSRQWLQRQGKNAAPIELTIHREGWRFPHEVDFKYIAFVYLP